MAGHRISAVGPAGGTAGIAQREAALSGMLWPAWLQSMVQAASKRQNRNMPTAGQISLTQILKMLMPATTCTMALYCSVP